MRLKAGDLERIDKLFRHAFEDRGQPWVLVTPSFRVSNSRRFDWDIERRPAELPPLTRWFETSLQEVPSRAGPFEGADDIAVEPAAQSFYYWDGAAWGRPHMYAPLVLRQMLADESRGLAPRYWRGLTAQAAS